MPIVEAMPVDGQLLRVLYDPLSYIAGCEAADTVQCADRRSALNAALLDRLALPAFAPVDEDHALWVGRLLRGWDCIVAAAFLLACSVWKRHLMSLRLFQELEPQAHVFMQFDFPDKALAAQDVPCTRADLIAWGGAYLLRVVPPLPDWLIRRIELRFAQQSADRRFPSTSSQDLLCLSMALAYAQKDPGFCSRVRP